MADTLPLRIALLGAESTGKTWLSQNMAATLRRAGVRCEVVPEVLREWCEVRQRTPRPDEQAGIAAEQAARTEAACAPGVQVVLADTAPLMTAIYSDYLFQDRSLYPMAQTHQQQYHLTLVTGLDLPWVADGMRDGPHAQGPVDALLRQALQTAEVPYQVIYGQGQARLDNALLALSQLKATKLIANFGELTLTSGLFRSQDVTSRPWTCDGCSDGACEHRLFTQLLNPSGT